MDQLNTPLSDEEYQCLDDFLMSEAMGDEAMDVAMVDGFLTALVIGPEVVLPSRWLPEVWGKDEMVWESEAQANRYISLLMRHMNAIVNLMQEAPESFEPLLSYNTTPDGGEVPVLDEWCCGFVRGMGMSEKAWLPLVDDDENATLLMPIMLYGTQQGWDALDADKTLADRHEEFVTMLPGCVLGIKDFWDSVRRTKAAFQSVRHEAPVPGRNDPCPCGSGKKYKKCCGND